uniref:Uncharacterized protein n=1 Tax=Solanum lycopersicum TaxID=4081 RepID=A0A494G9U0_SOLLC
MRTGSRLTSYCSAMTRSTRDTTAAPGRGNRTPLRSATPHRRAATTERGSWGLADALERVGLGVADPGDDLGAALGEVQVPGDRGDHRDEEQVRDDVQRPRRHRPHVREEHVGHGGDRDDRAEPDEAVAHLLALRVRDAGDRDEGVGDHVAVRAVGVDPHDDVHRVHADAEQDEVERDGGGSRDEQHPVRGEVAVVGAAEALGDHALLAHDVDDAADD